MVSDTKKANFMEYTMKKFLSVFIPIIFILITLSACPSHYKGDTAELIISVSGASRTAYNTGDSATQGKLDHYVTLTSETETINLTFKAGTALETTLSPGKWNIRVDSYENIDGSPLIYATGAKDVTLKLGLNNETIDMRQAFQITFYNNGGNGTVKPIIVKAESDATLPDGSGFSRDGYSFDGWNTNLNGQGTSYAAGSVYSTKNTDKAVKVIPLYAKWKLNKNVTFNSVTANGSALQTTTQLTLTFSEAITGLTASDITLSGVSGVGKGTLSGSGATYTLTISGFTTGGTLNVAVAKSGYNISGSPKTVTIYYYTVANQTPVVSDYNISGTGTFTYDGNPKTVTVTRKDGKSTGTVTVKYNGSTVAPSVVGTYSVTFDVAAASGWNAVTNLSAGTLTIIELSVEMVHVPGGSFQMGRSDGYDLEQPVHTVTLSSFNMGKYEVTQEQWIAVMENNPSDFTGSPASGEVQQKRPVERVSWYDTLVFCNKLSMIEGLSPAYRISGSTDPANWGSVPTSGNSTWDAVQIVAGSTGYRLPTEAQWEYAARGGNGLPGNYTYSGSNTVDNVAWYTNNSGSKTHEVGKKAPNDLGLYDMSGNVWEWCWDWFENYPSGTQTNPGGADSGFGRVVRGGDWVNSAEVTRSTYRHKNSPYDRYSNLGFRLVCP
jgi:formylglycine-generating enzyme